MPEQPKIINVEYKINTIKSEPIDPTPKERFTGFLGRNRFKLELMTVGAASFTLSFIRKGEIPLNELLLATGLGVLGHGTYLKFLNMLQEIGHNIPAQKN